MNETPELIAYTDRPEREYDAKLGYYAIQAFYIQEIGSSAVTVQLDVECENEKSFSRVVSPDQYGNCSIVCPDGERRQVEIIN
jgi:hypothetical protein